MKFGLVAAPVLRLLAACAVAAALTLPAAAADAVFPIASRLGLVPPPELKLATSFPGFVELMRSLGSEFA